MNDLESAVRGWKQAVGIISRLREDLQFCFEEVEVESKRNPKAFGNEEVRATLLLRRRPIFDWRVCI